MLHTTKKRNFGAISTEYVIILVLIAVAGILAFMMLGGQMRSTVSNSIDKISGKTETTEKVQAVNTAELIDDKPDMTSSESGAAETQVVFE